MSKIKSVKGRQILDSRGNPTVEVEVRLDNEIMERASVPSGASRGTREAVELRDGDKDRFLGRGVTKAISNVNQIIFPEIANMEVTEQRAIDEEMIELDGTENKSRLGANAILGVSLAVAKAAASDLGIPMYRYIGMLYGEANPHILPVPMLNVINGGRVAKNNLAFQAFMIVPLGADSFAEALRIGVETFHNLKEVLKSKKCDFSIGDEGGFSPLFHDQKEEAARIEDAIKLILEGIKLAGHNPYQDVVIALDPAATVFHNEASYVLDNDVKTSKALVDFYSYLVAKYPIVSIEDGLAEEDWDGWKLLTDKLGSKIQLVGDDLFVTNPKIFKDGVERKIANAINIMPNQIGTLSETLQMIRLAKDFGYSTIISHRSGETEDTTISDIAVGCNAGQIKAGGVSRTDRTAKYNQLLRIEEELGDNGLFVGREIFSQGT